MAAAYIDPKLYRVILSSASAALTKPDGTPVSPTDYPITLTYNGDNTVATESFTDGTSTWTKTYGYTAGNLTSDPAWVRT